MNKIKVGCFVGGLGTLTWAVSVQAEELPTISPNSLKPREMAGVLDASGVALSPVPLASPETLSPLETAEFSDPWGESLDQVNSVAELSDVKPGDWAYQAVQSLVERYGFKGYPDGTFRGNRSLTRYEFAAGLQQVLDQAQNRIQRGQSIGSQDLVTLQRLQQFYSRALSDLNTRFDDIRDRTTQLESQQFSTTTKLSGQAVLAPTGGTDAGSTFISRTRLGLTTSFNGRDRLVTELEAGNNGGDAVSLAQERGGNLLGTNGLLVDGGGLDYIGVSEQLRIRRLAYTFQPLPNLNLTVGARLVPSDFIDRNTFANQSARNFSSSFFANNPLIVQNQIDRTSGAGAALAWEVPGSPLALRALYIASDADSPNQSPGGGLLGDRNQASVELEYAPNRAIAVRLQYTHATINGSSINAGGVNAEWAFNRQWAVFGRYGFGSYQGFNRLLGQELDVNPQTWAVGVAVRNLIIPGSQAGLAIGQPFITGGVGNATQTNIEAFGSLLLNDNFSISPSLIVVFNPDNRARPTIYQGTVRFVFSF